MGKKTMNDILQSLYRRKSVRVFEDQEISSNVKNAILKAAVMAPTAGNQQLYTILDITDQSIKDRLVDSCDHQPFIAGAKMVLIFCADCRKWHQAFQEAGCTPRKSGVGDLMLAVTDAAIAAQNAVAAAESMGVGSCYIGDIMENCEIHRGMLNLPECVFPCCMLVFGYPTRQQMERKKPERVAMEHIVHENGYREMNGEEYRRMFAARCGEKGYDEWMRAFCKRKFDSDFSREMTRSVAEYMKDFQ